VGPSNTEISCKSRGGPASADLVSFISLLDGLAPAGALAVALASLEEPGH
jgi:hypothetical protein